MESLRPSRIEREPTAARARTKLRKHARQIRGHTAVHMRRAIHAILVLAKIVPIAPMRVRKHRVGFDNQLELFLVSALDK
jgi:hypothetical protein